MKKVVLLGAGASKCYSGSKTGVYMPISNDFFDTFRKLDISTDPWVLVGNLVNYLVLERISNPVNFIYFNENIEVLHSEIQEKLQDVLKLGNNFWGGNNSFTYLKAYNELIFLFTNVINEIQNGRPSITHISLAKQLSSEDTIITFNWDTLMDRALAETTNWQADYGYFVRPQMIYRDDWVKPNTVNQNSDNFPNILKMHGSSNWLTSHTMPVDGKLELMQETPSNSFYVYENTVNPYSTYKGRFKDGYEDFSYGYYPPNLPLKGKDIGKDKVYYSFTVKNPFMEKGESSSGGLHSMPLIIPPVKRKEYNQFGDLFQSIWKEAEDKISDADKIYIIGYSFPSTDYRTNQLFTKAFMRRQDMPEIVILNPYPSAIKNKFIYEFGIKTNNIKTITDTFNEEFILE